MTFGFHWFVAWRYLMSHERKVSPAVVAVAGATFVVSGILGGGNAVTSRSLEVNFAADWAYRNVLIAAVGLYGASALALLFALIRYCLRSPGKAGVPLLMLGGLMLCAIGALASGFPHGFPSGIAAAFLVVGVLFLSIGALGCKNALGGRAGGLLFLAALMVVAGATATVVAHSALAPLSPLDITFSPDRVVLPGLGLLCTGICQSVFCSIRYSSPADGNGKGLRVAAGWASLFLLAGAVYPAVARALWLPEDLVQYEPTHFAGHIFWAGLGVTAVSVLALVVLAALVGRLSRAHLRALVAAFVALAIFGGLAAGIAHFVLSPPPYVLVTPLHQGPNYNFLLVALGGLTVGVLAMILVVVRDLFTFYTTVSIAGVTVGTMALVIVLSVMSGFESDLRDKILGSNAHVLITKKDGAFTEYRQVASQIGDVPGVVATTPYLVSEVVLAASNNYSNVIIKGIDPETVGAVTDLDDNIEKPERALERLWPLAEDGSILGPPSGEGTPGPGADPGGDTPEPNTGGGDPLPDPPPPDMDVDIDDPADFSGLGGARGQKPDEDPAAPWADSVPDPPPDDMELDDSDPIDFSGEPDSSGGGDRSGIWLERDDLADPDEPDDPGERVTDDLGVPLEPLDITAEDYETNTSAFELADGDLEARIPARVATLPGVLVGQELEKQIHVYTGQEVRVISPLAEDTPAGPIPRTRFLRVAGIFFTGMYEYDLKLVYVPLPTLQAFLDLGDEVTGIEIRIADPDDTELSLQVMSERLSSDYRVQDWKEINRNLFSALELEKIAMFLILAIIILVAAFSIIGNQIMVVVEKGREIALIKTLGAATSGIMNVFIAQGFFMGLVGTIMGVALGLLACLLGIKYGIPLDPQVYYIDRLPIHVELPSVLAVIGAGIVISVVATLYPAAVAARLRPVEKLRDE